MSAVPIADLYRSLLQPTMEYRIYNGGATAVEDQYNARFYRIPARTEYWIDPETNVRWPEPGTLPIRGYNYTRKEGKELVAVTITALEIVQYLVGDDGMAGRLGKAGLRPLFPGGDNDGTNDAIKAQAAEAADLKAYEDAGHIIAAFEAANSKRLEMGVEPKSPDLRQRAAYRLRADADRQGSLKRLPFSCPKCYEGAETAETLRSHIEDLHSAQAPTLLKSAGLVATSPGSHPPPDEPEPDKPEDEPAAKMRPIKPKEPQATT